ncbi:MAG: hypothetical protein ACREEM_05740 [Blastocatellia bacterium]
MTSDPAPAASRLIAVCDACVLYSITMADLLTSLGEAGLFHPRWTNEIHDEWIRNLVENRGVTRVFHNFRKRPHTRAGDFWTKQNRGSSLPRPLSNSRLSGAKHL